MTLFLIAAAAMIAAALAFVLLPLLRTSGLPADRDRDTANARLYRDARVELETELAQGTIGDTQYREARQEFERRLLEDAPQEPAAAQGAAPASSRLAAIGLSATIPIAAIVLYALLGNPQAIDPAARAAPDDSAHSVTPEKMLAMVEKLALRLEQSPDDVAGWVMLARSYAAMGRFEESVRAYVRLVKLVPGDAGLLADFADTLAMTRGKKLAGEPLALVQQALKIDPGQFKALALAGSAEFERGNYAAAIAYWERSAAQSPADSEFGISLRASIEEARSLGKLAAPDAKTVAKTPASTQKSAESAQATSAGAEAITGIVTLSPALAARARPGESVFVFARPAEGSRMPLAIVRISADQLPYEFRLDDSLAMMPNARLSAQSSVVVGARISKTGDAKASPGDLQGVSAPVAPGKRGLQVTIDEIVK